jgi:hypothetical protein
MLPIVVSTHLVSARNSSGPRETKQWGDMIAKPRQAAVVWHRYSGQYDRQAETGSFGLAQVQWAI